MPAWRWSQQMWKRMALWGGGAVVVFLVLGTIGHLSVRPKLPASQMPEVAGAIAQERSSMLAATAVQPMPPTIGDYGEPRPVRDGAIELTALTNFGREIIRTGDLRIEVDDLENAFAQVQRIADSVGAMVTDANLARRPKAPGEAGKPEPSQGQFTLRVPGRQFFALLTALDQVGTVVVKQVSSNDVTEQFVDLESRLRHWRAQEEQLLALMRRADAIKDILTVRNELAQVQLEIERLSGQLRFLRSHVDLSTVTVTLVPTGTTKKAPEVLPFGAQIGAGWDKVKGAFLASLRDLVTGLTWAALVTAYLIPFAILVLLGLHGYRIVRPRLLRKTA